MDKIADAILELAMSLDAHTAALEAETQAANKRSSEMLTFLGHYGVVPTPGTLDQYVAMIAQAIEQVGQ
jgi:hypothetical protein